MSGSDPLKLVGPKSNLGDAEFKKFGFRKKDRGTVSFCAQACLPLSENLWIFDCIVKYNLQRHCHGIVSIPLRDNRTFITCQILVSFVDKIVRYRPHS